MTRKLSGDLWFANGVALSRNEDFLVVSETHGTHSFLDFKTVFCGSVRVKLGPPANAFISSKPFPWNLLLAFERDIAVLHMAAVSLTKACVFQTLAHNGARAHLHCRKAC